MCADGRGGTIISGPNSPEKKIHSFLSAQDDEVKRGCLLQEPGHRVVAKRLLARFGAAYFSMHAENTCQDQDQCNLVRS